MSDQQTHWQGFGPIDPERFVKMIGRAGHGGALNASHHAHGDDWCELKMPYSEALVGDPETGILASGPIIAMLDMATSISIWLKRGVFIPHATLDLRVDYLRASPAGRTLYARGECYHLSRSIGFVRGIAHDGDPDDPVAHAAGTFMVTEMPK